MNSNLTMPAEFGALEQLQPYLDHLIGTAPDRTRSEVMLAIHELCTNVIEHGYAGVEGSIIIRANVEAGVFTITLRDHAPNAYETSREIAAPAPDSLPEGGWGMFIVHQVMDEVHYTRHADGNEWRLTKTL